jgi:tetratricopeptide (TPR) repeat protein
MRYRLLPAVLAFSFGVPACIAGPSSQIGMDLEAPETDGPEEAAHHAAHDHGEVDFPVSCNEAAQARIETGLGHLHHMMYEQAQPHFEAAAKADPECAMAHWGVAMTSFQPLWHPTSDADLARGKDAVRQARALGAPTAREMGYIAAAEAFFTDPDPPEADRPADHRARVAAWKQAQRTLHEAHPEDVDAAAFYALALVAAAPPLVEDRSYTMQRAAGAILEPYFEAHPEHPGLFHYLIHAYDNPVLAPLAEEIARGYDQIAPDVPHALHMPSHIFVRLGQWEETAAWNERSAEAAWRQPVDGITSLHYPHALDYAMYAYLQLEDTERARHTLRRIEAIEAVQPVFASAYGIAAPRARYYVEQAKWAEAASLEPGIPDALPWAEFPGAEALIHYARGLGAARSGDLEQAEAERARIAAFVAALEAEGDDYWADQTRVLQMTVEAWSAQTRGEGAQGLARMREAADLEDSMEKHPITPGPIRPARELYGEMLLLEGRADEALEAFRTTLEKEPNRRNAVRGAEQAAEAAGRAGVGQGARGP